MIRPRPVSLFQLVQKSTNTLCWRTLMHARRISWTHSTLLPFFLLLCHTLGSIPLDDNLRLQGPLEGLVERDSGSLSDWSFLPFIDSLVSVNQVALCYICRSSEIECVCFPTSLTWEASEWTSSVHRQKVFLSASPSTHLHFRP